MREERPDADRPSNPWADWNEFARDYTSSQQRQQQRRPEPEPGWEPEPVTQPFTRPRPRAEQPPPRDGDTRLHEAPAPEPQAADPATAPAADPDEDVARARRVTQPHPGLVAVDFGTSSSTATLYDIGRRDWMLFSPQQQRRLLGELSSLLRDDPGRGNTALSAEWHRFVQNLAERLLRSDGSGPPSAERLVALLRSDTDSTIGDRLILELERSRPLCSPALRRLVTTRLSEAYDAAFREPPLDSLRLFRVELDPSTRATELRSAAYVVRKRPLTVSMLPPSEGDEAGEDARREHRGLKQRLGRPDARTGPDGEFAVEDLIRGVLSDLLARTDQYLARRRNSEGFAPGEVNNVLVTYPTMSPPRVRQALQTMVEADGVGRVITRFDEAVGAAMFFLMREFGGVFDLSVEAFAARSRPVLPPRENANRAEWEQHVLIVDIGGGTTDIALLRLELADRTPAAGADGDPHYGRYYRLTPWLLGTTGETQRGGDYLTLLVFNWLKAVIAERIIRTPAQDGPYGQDPRKVIAVFDDRFKDSAGQYVPGSLLAAILSPKPGTRETARENVQLLVPTQWKDKDGAAAEQARQVFDLLWDLAERAKITLGAEKSYLLPQEEVDQIMSALGYSGDPGGPGEELRHEDFATLIRPVLADIMRLAADLVRGQLTERGGAALDRVIFTGRSSRMNLVREELITAFSERRPDERGQIDWDPSSVWIEDEYAKHAASIGSCWAESLRQEVHPDPKEVEDHLRRGAVWLQVDVENLFFFLRGTFTAGGQTGSGSAGTTPLFSSGDRLPQLGGDGQLIIRNDRWIGLTESFQVYRQKSTSEPVYWTFFRVADYLQANPEPGFAYDEDVWRTDIRAMVEADTDMDMHVLLCRGPAPHYAVGHDRHGVLDAPPGERHLGTPASIVVNPGIPGSMTDGVGEPVFDLSDLDTLLTATFVTESGEDAETFRGVFAELPPPAPYGWRFYLRPHGAGTQDAGADTLVATVSPSQVTGRDVPGVAPRFTVSLDERGDLRVHRGDPPFRAASGLREVERVPGTVFRAHMFSGDLDYREAYDPFAGVH
ncbi:hypothetical protein Skr01_59330 [Sphaerisporangium krabiense]|uniref:Molecular chaperone n=1 Tax=Sphaerisporangium krabiense TaxID=763782 RepID=A0A7W9DTT5_9ACTN|nr:hypothetical protein [Sphaerisporangium krabiense]MBB5630966.1 hypothetical protein [Sphaerisporangium krabiense]GII65848.1 hypothetical protein Skr01_59330 [Sphaerisporangium krabiense]